MACPWCRWTAALFSGDESNSLREELKGMLVAGTKKIVLNMAPINI
jgi:hypothetical protein